MIDDHNPRRPSHGWPSSSFDAGTQNVFEDLADSADGSASTGPVVAGRRTFLPRDPRGHLCQPDFDPLGETGVCDRSAGNGFANRRTTRHSSFVADFRRAVAVEVDAAGLRLLPEPLVVRSVGLAVVGTGTHPREPRNGPPGDAPAGVCLASSPAGRRAARSGACPEAAANPAIHRTTAGQRDRCVPRTKWMSI